MSHDCLEEHQVQKPFGRTARRLPGVEWRCFRAIPTPCHGGVLKAAALHRSHGRGFCRDNSTAVDLAQLTARELSRWELALPR